MKATEFKNVYEKAKTVDIKNNDWFNVAGWFWLNLTDKQHAKMFDLICEQNHLQKYAVNYVTLRNGMQVLSPYK